MQNPGYYVILHGKHLHHLDICNGMVLAQAVKSDLMPLPSRKRDMAFLPFYRLGLFKVSKNVHNRLITCFGSVCCVRQIFIQNVKVPRDSVQKMVMDILTRIAIISVSSQFLPQSNVLMFFAVLSFPMTHFHSQSSSSGEDRKRRSTQWLYWCCCMVSNGLKGSTL